MKKCYRCKELKPLENFHKNSRRKDGRIDICKSCRNLENKAKYVPKPKREGFSKSLQEGAKFCKRCGIKKPLDGFHRHSQMIDKRNPVCKECSNKIKRDLTASKRALAVPVTPGYKICNVCLVEKPFEKFSFSKARNIYCYACKDCYNEISRKTFAKKRESINKKHREYYDKNKISIRIKHKEYFDKTLEQRRERKHKRLSNPINRLRANISRLFLLKLKNQNTEKFESTFSYTGISMEEYSIHLQNDPLWNDYMNKSYPIHIDHIIPSSLYDLTNPEEIKKCWNPNNLRLLPASENLSKGGKLDMELVLLYKIEKLLPLNIKNA